MNLDLDHSMNKQTFHIGKILFHFSVGAAQITLNFNKLLCSVMMQFSKIPASVLLIFLLGCYIQTGIFHQMPQIASYTDFFSHCFLR